LLSPLLFKKFLINSYCYDSSWFLGLAEYTCCPKLNVGLFFALSFVNGGDMSLESEQVVLWVETHPLSPLNIDCVVAVMLKILDGKCKMRPEEKRL